MAASEAETASLKGEDAELKKFLEGEEEEDDQLQEYIKSMVFGGLDGIITTFAVVAAGAGADLEGTVVVLMGIANLVSDGISMGLGDYFSEKSENEYIMGEKKREAWEMQNNPEGEVLEMVEILRDNHKMEEEDAKEIVTTYAKYPSQFVDFMMVHELELGVPDEDTSGMAKNGWITMLSFWFFGAIPVCAFGLADVFGAPKETRLLVDICVTLFTLALLGGAGAKINGTPICRSSIEMLINGGLACAASYFIAWGLAEAMGGNDVLCLGATCAPPVDDAYRFNNAPWLSYETPVDKPSTPDQMWDCSATSKIDPATAPADQVFYTRVNLFSGEVGNYEFVGHDGTAPELTVEIGKTYHFDQTHHTNWYHPLGFGYFPDGAHGKTWGSEERPEIDAAVAQGGGLYGSALSYRINNVESANNLEDFEEQFFWPRDEWLQRKYTVELKITDEIAREAAKHGGVLYYFCHVHSKMSGKLRITGTYQKDGSAFQKKSAYESTAFTTYGPELNEYVPHTADAFDTMCGTSEASPYKLGSGQCAGTDFLCDMATPPTTFEACMHAIDCKMKTEMTVSGHDVHGDATAIFMQQMIPHHTNAVNMARVMLTTTDTRSDSFGNNLMYEIINNQNAQIHAMRNYLSDRRHTMPQGAACSDLSTVYQNAGLTMEYQDDARLIQTGR